MSGDTWKRRAMARWLVGNGIEIGALHNPLHLPRGARVQYVDRAPTTSLQGDYPDLGELVPVSVVGDATDLSAFADESLDFIVANHVMEHLPDPIRALCEISRVTRSGGLLYFAIPDPRATFDRLRPVTDIDHLVAEYRHGTDATRREHFREFVELAHWQGKAAPSDMEKVEERIDFLLRTDYSIHYHVFRPDTFLGLLEACRREANLIFELVAFEACDARTDDEFIFVIAKGIDASSRSTPRLIPGEHIARRRSLRGLAARGAKGIVRRVHQRFRPR